MITFESNISITGILLLANAFEFYPRKKNYQQIFNSVSNNVIFLFIPIYLFQTVRTYTMGLFK